MEYRHDRLTKFGVAALAGIAVLGWIREPEKHQFPGSPVSVNSSPTQSRKTFYPRPTLADQTVTARVPEAVLGAIPPARETHSLPASGQATERGKRNPIEVNPRTSPVVKTPEPPQAHTGRHEDPQSVEHDVVTRSRVPQTERSKDGQGSEQPRSEQPRSEQSQDDRTPLPRADRTEDNRPQTQPSVIGKKERSTVRSAAIILGTAAAGAAIGAAAGGGKGATIGAVTGGAGGYVYDRMTRRNLPGIIDNNDPNSHSDADQQGNYSRYDRAPSLARRFGTPNFNER